jgi:hypothetical protein
MARDVGLRVEGLTAMVRHFQQMGADVEDLKVAFSSVADEGARVMRGFVPTRSGRLQASIRGNRAKSKAVVTVGRASVPYAGPIQWGWPARNIAPAGFFEKTDQVMNGKAVDLLETEITRLIRARF